LRGGEPIRTQGASSDLVAQRHVLKLYQLSP
jgi:hypothetical protein